jgi:hypothetical protein
VALEEGVLLELLASDGLALDSELEVWQALAAWTEHDASRRGGLAARLARCVRLGRLGRSELEIIDVHPLVRLAGGLGVRLGAGRPVRPCRAGAGSGVPAVWCAAHSCAEHASSYVW